MAKFCAPWLRAYWTVRVIDCSGMCPMMNTSGPAAPVSLEKEITGTSAARAGAVTEGMFDPSKGPRISLLPSAIAWRAAASGPLAVS